MHLASQDNAMPPLSSKDCVAITVQALFVISSEARNLKPIPRSDPSIPHYLLKPAHSSSHVAIS